MLDATRRYVLRRRSHGRLWFGREGDLDDTREHWSISDPESDALEEAMWRMRYAPQHMTSSDRHNLLAAAEAYQHLCCYTLRCVAKRQFADVCRALRDAF